MRHQRDAGWFAAIVLAAGTSGIVSSCGSGDACPPGPKGCGDTGGFEIPTNLASAPGEAALVGYLRGGHQTMLAATDPSGNGYSLTASTAPIAGTSTFAGSAPAYSTAVTLTVDKNGAPATSVAATVYYLLNPYVPLGTVYGSGTPYAVTTSSTPLPTTLHVGDSGPVNNVTYYHDATLATVDANSVQTYVVKADNPITLLVCLTTVISDLTAQGTADGLDAGSETDCYSVDASGNAALLSIALTVNGATLNFT